LEKLNERSPLQTTILSRTSIYFLERDRVRQKYKKMEIRFFIFPHPNPLPEFTAMFLTSTVAGRGDSFI
jgi:hypothetical protein